MLTPHTLRPLAAAMLLFLTSMPLPSHAADTTRVVTARQFGAIPDDGRDDTKALRAAAEYCRRHPGTTLVIAPGTYRLRDAQAERLESDVMAGKMGNDPEKKIFTPYYPYARGLDFDGAVSTHVMARGATLMCEGWMEPVSIVNTRDFTLEGLTIDYRRKPMTEGNIIAIGDDSFTVQFDSRRQLTPSMPITRMSIWDDEASGVFPTAYYFPKPKFLGDNRLEFAYRVPRRLLGARIAALHSFHFRPAIFINRSHNTVLEGVTIHAQPGMGIVGFDTEDVFIRRLAVTPADGFTFSTNTDATHFASCRGTVSIEDSFFHAQGDDATNVHGYYNDIRKHDGGWVTLVLNAPTFTHAQMADVPAVGDTLELSHSSTLVPVARYAVTEVRHEPQSPTVDVRLSGNLPSVTDGMYLFNASKLPRLRFCRNTVWGQLARGVLAKTRGVLIAENTFRGCTGTAIHVAAEAEWREGAHSRDVVIRDNMMMNCGLDGGQFGASGIAVVINAPDTDGTLLHEHVTITGNTIQTRYNNSCGMALRNIRGLHVSGNVVRGCREAMTLHSCEDVVTGQ